MRAELTPHPDWPCPAIERIRVEVERSGPQSLSFRYEAAGQVSLLRLPSQRPPVRTDGLWQATCFEAFLRPAGAQDYFEFNFAPSGAWAAYAFSGYRQGMRPLEPQAAPVIVTAARPDRLAVEVNLPLPDLGGRPWRLGLSAVIEALDGAKSYWAVTHPPGKADFHHPDCFALQLPEAQTP
jgi:hypothetical protein